MNKTEAAISMDTKSLTSNLDIVFSSLKIHTMIFLCKKITVYSYFFARVKALVKYGFLFEKSKWVIRNAGIKGEGMFASEFIKKGDVVFVASGTTHYFISETYDDAYEYPDWYGIDKNVWVAINAPYVKANHSCNPNIGIDGTRIFVALNDINKGDEISFDYSTTDDELNWHMECSCQASDCRKIVSGIQTLSLHHFNKSEPFIPQYFYKLYKENNIDR